MLDPAYDLALDRTRRQPLRQQAAQAIMHAIRTARPGFELGDRLSNSELARRNRIHRNTLRQAMDDLVRLGYLRRLPNKGFEVVERAPDRPPLLTNHFLSISEVAGRHGLRTHCELIPAGCGQRRMEDLQEALPRLRNALSLPRDAMVSELCRRRQVRSSPSQEWADVAIERSFMPARHLPHFLTDAREQVARQGCFSLYAYLRQAFPHDSLFKALYEISLTPLPGFLLPYWTSPSPPMTVVTVTYCSVGPIELTYTWFDPTRAVLLAGTLDIRLA
jgi:DNA-binding GntR family transcriptional regulator